MNSNNTNRRRLSSLITVIIMGTVLMVASIFPNITALAKDKYESNQITNAINECGEGDLPLDIFCENLGSEIQGNENLATIIGTQSGVGPTGNGGGDGGGGETPMTMNKDIGVLIYTHGFPNNPLTFKPDMQKLAAIEYDTESLQKLFGEKITHMPYIWDYGLMGLDKTLDLESSSVSGSEQSTSMPTSLEESGSDNNNNKYAIFLYTDLFGPNSTVIHNVTRGVFGGIEEYNHCPGIVVDESNSHFFDSEHQSFTAVVQKYGPICFYMGHIHIPAEIFSDTKFVFAEPARPDHPILRDLRKASS